MHFTFRNVPCLETWSRIPVRTHTLLPGPALPSCLIEVKKAVFKVSPHFCKTVHWCFDNLQLQHFEWLQAVTSLVVRLISEMAWWQFVMCLCMTGLFESSGSAGCNFCNDSGSVTSQHLCYSEEPWQTWYYSNSCIPIYMQPSLSTALDRQAAVCPRHKMSLSSFCSVSLSYPLSSSEFYSQHIYSTELDWGQQPCRFKMQSGWKQNTLFSLTGWSELQSCSPSPRVAPGKAVHPEGGAEGRVSETTLPRAPSPRSDLWICIQGMELISVWLLIDTEISLICLLAGES